MNRKKIKLLFPTVLRTARCAPDELRWQRWLRDLFTSVGSRPFSNTILNSILLVEKFWARFWSG